jgi:hypothetical protein
MGGLLTLRQNLKLSSLTGSLLGGEIQVLREEEDPLRTRGSSEPQVRTVQQTCREKPLLQ